MMDNSTKISDRKQQQYAYQRAMSIPQFCERYDLCRTKAYEEINSGRLRARKIGTRTIVAVEDAEDWLDRLPLFGGSK